MNKRLVKIVPVLATLLGLSLSPGAYAQAVGKGSAAAGEQKAAMCIGCHGIPGYQASFPEIHKVPMISGQSASYIAAALIRYQKGERKHPSMKAIAGSLTEQDILDLSAFYERHVAAVAAVPARPAAPSPQVAALLAKGECASCHGDNFSKPSVDEYPKLAGQHADYLYVALKAYQSQGNAMVGRSNATMAARVQGYTRAELKAMAQYIASLEGELQVVSQSRLR